MAKLRAVVLVLLLLTCCTAPSLHSKIRVDLHIKPHLKHTVKHWLTIRAVQSRQSLCFIHVCTKMHKHSAGPHGSRTRCHIDKNRARTQLLSSQISVKRYTSAAVDSPCSGSAACLPFWKAWRKFRVSPLVRRVSC